jgi:hypothetical protein
MMGDAQFKDVDIEAGKQWSSQKVTNKYYANYLSFKGTLPLQSTIT